MPRKPARSSPTSHKAERRASRPETTARHDPDDAPEWTSSQLARAELAEGGKVIRPAGGTVTRGRGRPKLESPKKQVSVRLDPDVIEALRGGGPGWQAWMNDALRKALKL